jgi:hypothetical protein
LVTRRLAERSVADHGYAGKARMVMRRSGGLQALAGPRVPPVTIRCAEQCHAQAGDGQAWPSGLRREPSHRQIWRSAHPRVPGRPAWAAAVADRGGNASPHAVR